MYMVKRGVALNVFLGVHIGSSGEGSFDAGQIAPL
jgi:hypothetical protein